MPTSKNRELIPVSTQAHKHLRDLVEAMNKNGLPTNGTLLASQVILSIPLPAPQPIKPVEKKRRTRKTVTPMSQVVPVLGA